MVVAGLVAGLAALAAVTPAQLERLPRSCLWSRLAGGPCPACGTLRALCSLLHGDLPQALRYNRNVLVVAPVLMWVGLGQFGVLWRRPRCP